MYPLFYRALIDTYKPAPGKCVVLDGAPPRPVSKQEYMDNGGIEGNTFKTVSFSRVFLDQTAGQLTQQGANVLATPKQVLQTEPVFSLVMFLTVTRHS